MPPSYLPERPPDPVEKATGQNLGRMAITSPETVYPQISHNSQHIYEAKKHGLHLSHLAIVVVASFFLLLVSGGLTFALYHATKPQPLAVTKTPKKTIATTPAVQTKPTQTTTPGQTTTTTTTPQNQTVQKPPTQTQKNSADLPPNTQVSTGPYVGSLSDTLPVYVSGGSNYYYAGTRQFVTASGASVNLTQAQPAVGQSAGIDNHSLMELAIESSDGQQIVEIGWTVDPGLNGDTLPHLFVYHWVAGQTSCYNGCGFVQTGGTAPGSVLSANTTGTFGISYSAGAWNLSYNNSTIGYFPGSLWSGTFTQLGLVQIFGEVSINPNSTTKCIQMGNGIAGSSSGSARISNVTLTGASLATALSPYATSSSPYSYGSASATGVNIGGPGIC